MTQQPQVVVRRAVAAVGSAVEDNSRVAPEEVLKSTGFRTRRVAAAGGQHDAVVIDTHILGVDDFIGLYILQHTVLVDA